MNPLQLKEREEKKKEILFEIVLYFCFQSRSSADKTKQTICFGEGVGGFPYQKFTKATNKTKQKN